MASRIGHLRPGRSRGLFRLGFDLVHHASKPAPLHPECVRRRGRSPEQSHAVVHQGGVLGPDERPISSKTSEAAFSLPFPAFRIAGGAEAGPRTSGRYDLGPRCPCGGCRVWGPEARASSITIGSSRGLAAPILQQVVGRLTFTRIPVAVRSPFSPTEPTGHPVAVVSLRIYA